MLTSVYGEPISNKKLNISIDLTTEKLKMCFSWNQIFINVKDFIYSSCFSKTNLFLKETNLFINNNILISNINFFTATFY